MQREHICDIPWMETSDDERTKKKERKKKKTNKQIYFNSQVVIKLTLDYKLHEQLCPVWCAGQSWA